ncbi:ArnT family glycosyltransferase [Saccharopolyspora rosea]|uniref:ArnT family glycosyltransferase n=1 Tax=Saccharopolyspora rosea TaxID=524884 RepID=A0ABW3FPW3_9PSEU|nr:glycosyltransferase family 39 protein [Saccharopolyspora rosea]
MGVGGAGTAVRRAAAPPEAAVGRPAWGWLLLVAAGLCAVLLVLAGICEQHGDELYFLVAGRHISWGYADQPPLLPLLARLGDELFGGARLGLRLPAVLLTSGGAVVTGLIARELGGGRGAQVRAALTYSVSPHVVATGCLLVTVTVDVFCWAVAALLLVRWVRLRDDRLLLALGGVVACALQAKYLIAVFCVAVLCAALLFGPAALLRRPKLWLGAGAAVAACVPSALWQARHGWPQLGMAEVVSAESAQLGGGRIGYLPLLLLTAGVVAGGVVACCGLWALLRDGEHRFLGVAALAVTGVFVLAGGRYYYSAGLLPLCWAAGAVWLSRPRPRGLRWAVGPASYGFSATLVAALVLAVWSSWSTPADLLSNAGTGWRPVVAETAAAYRALPPGTRAETSVVTEHYWQASALDRLGAGALPEAHSPHRGAWYFGPPPDGDPAVLFVGSDPGPLRRYFSDVRLVASPNPSHGKEAPIWWCGGRTAPWSLIWPRLRHL